VRKDSKRTRQALKPHLDLSDLHNLHQGRKCFVVGAAPSVGFLDLTPIHDHVVISVNSSVLLMPWDEDGDTSSRFWISNDTLCVQWTYFWSHTIRSFCTKMVRTSWKKHDESLRGYNFRYFSPRKIPDGDDLNLVLDGLCSVSSVPTAIDLALLMGCKYIYLLGVDHKMTHGNSHFWQFYDKKKWPQRKDKHKNFRPEQKHQKEMFKQNILVFKSLKKYAEQLNAKIYNCSKISTVKVFEKIPFEKSYA